MVVLPFASTLGPMTGPTTDLNTVGSAIETMKSGGGTAIADAILSASEAMEHVDGRHIFVLFTDGYDEHSNIKLDEAMEAVKKLHGTLYTVGINGAAARLVHPGDIVILIGYGQMDTAEAKELKPHVVFVDADNKILATGFDPAETFEGPGLVRGDLTAGR